MAAKHYAKQLVVTVLLILAVLFVWPGIFRYRYSLGQEVRVDLLTGRVQSLDLDGRWSAIAEKPQSPKPASVEFSRLNITVGAQPRTPADLSSNEDAPSVSSNSTDSQRSLLPKPTESESPDMRFHLGSTMNEVRKVQGTPSGVFELGAGDRVIWNYGASTVSFSNGRVSGYHDLSDNLHVN